MLRLFNAFAWFVLPALATSTTAHAQSNKPIRSGTFYEDRAINGTNSTGLVLTFAQTPADKFLNITHVSCTLMLRDTQTLTQSNMRIGTTNGATDTGRSFELRGGNITSTTANEFVSSGLTSNALYIKVGANRFPSISVVSSYPGTGSTYTSGDCTIVGDLSDS